MALDGMPISNLASAPTDSSSDLAPPLSPSTLSPSPSLKDPTESAEVDTGKDRPNRTRSGHGRSASPTVKAVPQYPPSPTKTSPKHGRDHSKSFFPNFKASKSSHRLQPIKQDAVDGNDETRSGERNRQPSRERAFYSSSKARVSTPDLLQNSKAADSRRERSLDRKAASSEGSRKDEAGAMPGGTDKRSKARFGRVGRAKSIRTDGQQRPSRLDLHSPSTPTQTEFAEPMKTAPLRSEQRERTLGESAGSKHRHRSADPHNRSQEDLRSAGNWQAGAATTLAGSARESNLFAGAADRLNKAGKGLLGRFKGNNASQEQHIPNDDNYVCTTITLPLVQQTRRTRIAQRLEFSNDKTEFWMPALPWRCIDYLNMNGCEVEGLYRTPGAAAQVKLWQRRFDTEHDINLFDEPQLRDINTVGSMFKAWLRNLPDEILPQAIQRKVAEQCADAKKTPQLLKDELSKLPPFNYYLLFAITCHLSLLNSFSDKNKMNYRNITICFQPCLKIDVFCFKFLVLDWKNCWQGCWVEKEYLEEEYRVQRGREEAESQFGAADADERTVSSSGSSQHPPTAPQQPPPKAPASRSTLLRKGLHNGKPKGSKATATTQGSSENATGGFSAKSSNASIRDHQGAGAVDDGDDEPDDANPPFKTELPALNPLSPIKL